MPINMQIEYPKLEAENIKLRMINDSLLEELKNVLWNFGGNNGFSNVQKSAISQVREAIKKYTR